MLLELDSVRSVKRRYRSKYVTEVNNLVPLSKMFLTIFLGILSVTRFPQARDPMHIL